MTISKTFIVNAQTGEEIIRELNADELAQEAIDIAEQEAKLIAAEQAEINKAAATAKLTALGLTTEDLKALGLGTN
jgi:hypothetical protein